MASGHSRLPQLADTDCPSPHKGQELLPLIILSYFMSLNQFSESQGSGWQAWSYAHPWSGGWCQPQGTTKPGVGPQ